MFRTQMKTFNQFFKKKQSIDESFVAGIPDAPTAKELGMVTFGGFAHHPSVIAAMEELEKKKKKMKEDELEEALKEIEKKKKKLKDEGCD